MAEPVVKFEPYMTAREPGGSLILDRNLIEIKKALMDANSTFVTIKNSINEIVTSINVTNIAGAQQGIHGMDGYDGDDGMQGARGPIGPQGIQGPQGMPGADADDSSADSVVFPRSTNMAQFWISTADPSVPNGVNLGALAAGVLQISVTSGVATPSTFTWPLAGRVIFSTGASTAPSGNAAFQWDDSSARTLFLGAGSSQKWANVGNLGDANTEFVGASWVTNVWVLKSQQTGTGTVRSMLFDAGSAAMSFSATTGFFMTSGSLTFQSDTGGTGHDLHITGNGSDGLFVVSAWDQFTLLNTHNMSIVADASRLTATGSPTVASAAGAALDAIRLSTGVTISGTTTIATATGFNAVAIPQPGYTTSGAGVTVTNAASLYIANAPLAGTSVTITNPYAMWIDNGVLRYDGAIALGGGAAATLGTIGGSGPGTAAQNKWIKMNVDGTNYFIPLWQ